MTGYTRTELVVLVVIGAAVTLLLLANLVYVPHGHQSHHICQNNLKQIGVFLIAQRAGKGWVEHPGAAFLLQVADEIKDEDLVVFVCPGEPEDPDDPRPELGSPMFVRMYRRLDLPDGVAQRHCSYAGPDWSKLRPKPGDLNYVIGADKCRHGRLHHEGGVVVLYASSKVTFLETADAAPALADLCYFPPR